jgi:subtilase family serine protease
VRVETRDGGWAVVVRNRGRTDSGPFSVTLAVDGAERPARELVGLAAGAKVTLIFQPSDCQAGLRVVVDARGAVDERDEGDNVLDVPCPA